MAILALANERPPLTTNLTSGDLAGGKSQYGNLGAIGGGSVLKDSLAGGGTGLLIQHDDVNCKPNSALLQKKPSHPVSGLGLEPLVNTSTDHDWTTPTDAADKGINGTDAADNGTSAVTGGKSRPDAKPTYGVYHGAGGLGNIEHYDPELDSQREPDLDED